MQLLNRVTSLKELLKWREKERSQGRTVVLTNGCFDLLHRGHIEYLEASAALGDSLVVAVNSDESVRSLKGPSRPINQEADRAFAISSLRAVTRAFIFKGPRLADEILQLKPDIYTKAGDYTIDTLDTSERGALITTDTKVIIQPFLNGYSTTSTLLKMIQ